MKVYPEEFHRLRASKRDNHINMYCEQERVRVFRIVSQLQAMGREVTAESVKEVLKMDSMQRVTDYLICKMTT